MGVQCFRVFCNSNSVPSPDIVLDSLQKQGIALKIAPHSEISDISPFWNKVDLIGDDSKWLFEVQIITKSSIEFQDELSDFMAIIEDAAEGLRGQKKVLSLLEETSFLVVIRLLSNAEGLMESDYKSLGGLLSYFRVNCDGMVQNDAEGFYDGKKLLLKFEWKS